MSSLSLLHIHTYTANTIVDINYSPVLGGLLKIQPLDKLNRYLWDETHKPKIKKASHVFLMVIQLEESFSGDDAYFSNSVLMVFNDCGPDFTFLFCQFIVYVLISSWRSPQYRI